MSSFNGWRYLRRRWTGLRNNAHKSNPRQSGVSMQALIKPRCECSRTRRERYTPRCPSGSLIPLAVAGICLRCDSSGPLWQGHLTRDRFVTPLVPIAVPWEGKSQFSSWAFSINRSLMQEFNSFCRNLDWSFALNWSKCCGLGVVESCCAGRVTAFWLAAKFRPALLVQGPIKSRMGLGNREGGCLWWERDNMPSLFSCLTPLLSSPRNTIHFWASPRSCSSDFSNRCCS